MTEGSNGKHDDPTDVETSTRLLIDRIILFLGLTMFVVGLVGEILGWWGEVGVIVSLGGLIAGPSHF